MQTYRMKRSQMPDSARQMGTPLSDGIQAGMPNSAMLSALGGDKSTGQEDLLQRILQRRPAIRMQAQIPQAEAEADRLSASIHSGTPDSVKAAMGTQMGADFSAVRFHTDAAAAARADAMGARAFTSGADVYFGGEGFDASVAAHELVHTAQQGMVGSETGVMSTPVGGVQMLRKPPVPSGRHQVNTGKFNFGKRAYENDLDLKNFHELLNAYNERGSVDDESALMNAAVEYIGKNSTGRKAKHKGRTAMMEDVLFQLTMKNGTKERADQNIDRLKDNVKINAVGATEASKNQKSAVGTMLENIRGLYSNRKRKHSKAMQMIAAEVMSKQGNTNDYTVNVGSGGNSTTSVPVINQNGRQYLISTRMIQSGKNFSMKDSLGTNLHEFTHVAVGESFGNTRMNLSYAPGTETGDVENEMHKRRQNLKNLEELAKTSSKKDLQINEASGDLPYYTNDRALYGAGMGQARSYADAGKIGLVQDLVNQGVVGRDTAEQTKIDTAKTNNAEGSYRPLIGDELSGWMTGPNAPAGVTLDNDEWQHMQNEYQELGKFGSLANKALEGDPSADAMVEYDPVINQLLSQYEESTRSFNRDSQYYRNLKAMALQAHVRRHIAALRRENPGAGQ